MHVATSADLLGRLCAIQGVGRWMGWDGTLSCMGLHCLPLTLVEREQWKLVELHQMKEHTPALEEAGGTEVSASRTWSYKIRKING